MNLKGIVEVEVVKNETSYRALLPMGRPWVEAHDALAELAEGILAYSKQLEEQAAQKQKADLTASTEPLDAPVLDAELIPN